MVRIQRLGLFLEAHFGEVEYHMPDEDLASEQEEPTSQGEPSFLIQLDDAEARINLLSMVRPSLSNSYRIYSPTDVIMHRRSIAAASHFGDVLRRSSRWQYQQ
jgi:hypothetical protein